MNNKKLGNAFEAEFIKMLSDNGYWATILAQTATGQPFDVIASKNGRFYGFDCKVCTNDRFTLSRIEDNQQMSMSKLARCGTTATYFALKLSDHSVHIIDWVTIENLIKLGKKSIGKRDILLLAIDITSTKNWWEL